MVEGTDEFGFRERIEGSIRQRLSLNMEHLGFIPRSKVIQESVRDCEVLLTDYADKPVSELIRIIAGRIIEVWEYDVDNSIDFIRNDAAYLMSMKDQVRSATA